MVLRWVILNYVGFKYIFFNSIDKSNNDDIIINIGKIVVVVVLDIVVKSGIDKIIFIG